MRKEIADLAVAVQNLTAQRDALVLKVDAEVANSNALKAALNAAIAGQLSVAERDALIAAELDIGKVKTDLATSTQKLADSAAINAPSN